MEREQIIKALECCISGDDCTICPLFNEQSCPCVLNENALSLIKELTEENEILKMKRVTIFERIESHDIGYKKGVREMKERLKKGLLDTASLFTQQRYIVDDVIDQIAKELIGETE